MEEEKKIERCKFAHPEINGETICTREGWKDDQVTPTNDERCESCDRFKSRYIEYPITVTKISCDAIKLDSWHCKTGSLVAVRPCGEEYQGKTYLGFFLGDMPMAITASHNSNTGELHCGTFSNPAMFVPELGKIIYGMGSWWSEIKSEDDFKQITDKDIDNVWYVKFAKMILERND